MAKEDALRCAVLFRDGPSKEWKLQCFTEKKSVALGSARMTVEQEARLGHRSFEAIVVTEKSYDAGDLKKRLWRGKASAAGVGEGQLQDPQ
jgi:hypothetical protein